MRKPVPKREWAPGVLTEVQKERARMLLIALGAMLRGKAVESRDGDLIDELHAVVLRHPAKRPARKRPAKRDPALTARRVFVLNSVEAWLAGTMPGVSIRPDTDQEWIETLRRIAWYAFESTIEPCFEALDLDPTTNHGAEVLALARMFNRDSEGGAEESGRGIYFMAAVVAVAARAPWVSLDSSLLDAAREEAEDICQARKTMRRGPK